MASRGSPITRLVSAAALAVFIAAVSASPSGARAQEPDRPNIVVVMTDDQGWGDLGVQGNPVIDTPNIDRLAKESVSVRRFYVSPVCTPTRACLMTGRYNLRTRAIDTFVGRAMMDPEEVTIAEVLKEGGYRTGIFGKWHLGDCYPLRAMDQGFDESLVHRGGGLAQPADPIENDRRYTDPILFRNGVETRTEGYCTDVYFDAALEFIEESRASETPFFTYIATNAPHGPFHDVPEDLYAKYRDRDLSPILLGNARSADTVARIFAMIENIDQNMGRLLETLERIDAADDTIVVYLHDNGPQTGRWVGDLRGTKSQVFEGGIRTPLFVRWPERFAAGRVVEECAAHIDIMPTLVAAAGLDIPAGLRVDGRSLLPLLRGDEDVAWPERTLYLQSHRGDEGAAFHNFAAVGPRWKLLRSSGFGRERPPEDAPFELYDIESDPGERSDLAAEKPEVVAAMKKAYAAWFEDISTTREDNWSPPRIVVGADAETSTTLTKQDWRRLEGGGWGEHGQWWLEFRGDHAYDVRVLTQREVPAGSRVIVRAGDVRAAHEVTEASRALEISDVKLPNGLAKLRVTIEKDGESSGPYQVILERDDG